MELLSGDVDNIVLPIITRLIPLGMGESLTAFCRTLESAAGGRAVDQTAVTAGLQALLGIAALPPAPAIPGVSWRAWEITERDSMGKMLRLESIAGDGLSLFHDQTGTPAIASWHRLGTEQAATFNLVQSETGWELEINSWHDTFRHPVVVPPGLTWASSAASSDAITGAVAGVVGAAIAAAGVRTGQSAEKSVTTAPPAPPPPVPAPAIPPPTPAKPEPVPWHYLLQGQPQGPVAEDDLRGWIAEGRLPADTLVWNPTLSDWQPAKEVGLVPVPAKRFCGNCGAPLTPEARFCGGCGNALV